MKRDRQKFENEILLLLARNGSMTWKELWVSIEWRKNKRFFKECLDELQMNGKITKTRFSHKRVVYNLSEDISLLKSIGEQIRNSEKLFPEVRNAIYATKKMLPTDAVTQVFEKLIYKELFNFLVTLETWVRVEDKWKDMVKHFLIRYNVEYFGMLLTDCGHANPIAMEQAMKNVFESLNALADKTADY